MLGIDVAQDPIQVCFKVGEAVRFVVSKTIGIIESIERYSVSDNAVVFYKVRVPGAVWIAEEEDIEPVDK